MPMIDMKAMNWCKRYNHIIDDELIHKICENPHPRGCANCPHIFYNKELTIHLSSEQEKKWLIENLDVIREAIEEDIADPDHFKESEADEKYYEDSKLQLIFINRLLKEELGVRRND